MLTGLGLTGLWYLTDHDDAHVDHFGDSLARSLASQVIEPLRNEDPIPLVVLTGRAAALPEVLGASVHGMDNVPLAMSGDVQRGRIYSSQVTDDGRSLGVVRIHIDPSAFTSAPSAVVMLAGLLWVVVAPGLILLMGSFARSRSLPEIIRRSSPGPSPAVSTTAPEQPPESITWDLISVNLFNQLSLSPEQCARELSYARDVAIRVAALYGGEVEDLPGTGLKIAFAAPESDEGPFHALCAAFILSRLLAGGESFGRYRLSLHSLSLPAHQSPEPGIEAVRDAAVLSALARENGIVVSESFFTRLPYNERLISQALDHPLLDELGTIGGGARLAVELADPHRDLVEEQLMEIADQEEPGRSTPRESTF